MKFISLSLKKRKNISNENRVVYSYEYNCREKDKYIPAKDRIELFFINKIINID